MKVKDVMSPEPQTCGPETTAAEAAHAMWTADCGFLPVLKDNALFGVVTDRDLFIALGTRNRLASELTVGEVCATAPLTCAPEDDVLDALHTMQRGRVHRLPVAVLGGGVVGVISIDDILVAAGPREPVRPRDVLAALQVIAPHHRHPVNG